MAGGSTAVPAPDTYPDGPVREAVARDGGRCSVCGRPCGEREAWRCREAGPLGDSADNFSAMCLKCALFLSREGVRPAQYVMHFYDAGRLRWVFSRLLVYVGGASLLTFYVMFAVLSYQAIFVWTRRTAGDLFGTVVISIVVVTVACYLVVAVWRFGRSFVAEARAVHRAARGAVVRAATWRSGAAD